MLGTRTIKGKDITVIDIVSSVGAPAQLTKEYHLQLLLREIRNSYEKCTRQIIVNMTNVTLVDTDAALNLIQIVSRCEGLKVCFYGMNSGVKNTFFMAGFFLIFKNYTDQQQAVASFIE